MNAQMMFQRICAISGIICPLLFFGAFVSAGFIPPLAPSSTAAEIAGHVPGGGKDPGSHHVRYHQRRRAIEAQLA